MSIRLWFLNLTLRLTAKRMLSRAQDPQKVRDAFEADAQRLFRAPDGANFIPDSLKRGEAGERIEMLWASSGRPDRRRVVLYLHGGAYIAGSIDTHRHLATHLAKAAGARALLFNYRLAPEHPFPAAIDDAEAVYRHLLDSGYDPGAIALAGDSAGGGLVFALLLRLEAQGLPAPSCAVGFSPWVDMRGDAASIQRNARRDVMLPAKRFHDVVDFYLANPADRTSPEASPILGRYQRPPPSLIFASDSEILESDARGLAECLRNAGGDVHLEIWRGLPHAWVAFAGLLAQSDQTIARAGAFIDRQLESSRPEPSGEPEP